MSVSEEPTISNSTFLTGLSPLTVQLNVRETEAGYCIIEFTSRQQLHYSHFLLTEIQCLFCSQITKQMRKQNTTIESHKVFNLFFKKIINSKEHV